MFSYQAIDLSFAFHPPRYVDFSLKLKLVDPCKNLVTWMKEVLSVHSEFEGTSIQLDLKQTKAKGIRLFFLFSFSQVIQILKELSFVFVGLEVT